MRADCFLDTNILLYAASHAEDEAAKRATARELLAAEGVGISTQVMAEFYVNATRKFGLSDEEVLPILQCLEDYPILPVDPTVFWGALEIRSRYGLSYWDAAIISAAVILGCRTLYSEDLNHGQVYAGVKVANPFLPDKS